MPHHLIFDFDGVLADTEPVAWRVQAEVLAEAGFPISAAEIGRYVGWTASKIYADIECQFGRPVPEWAAQRIRSRLVTAIRDELEPMPGLVSVLDELSTIYKMCVASNGTSSRVQSSVEVLGLANYFTPHIYSADLVTSGKPAPDLFLYAASNLGASPNDCLVIEDSLQGIAAALEADMRVFGFTGASHFGSGHADALAAAGAHRVFSNMADLPKIIRES